MVTPLSKHFKINHTSSITFSIFNAEKILCLLHGQVFVIRYMFFTLSNNIKGGKTKFFDKFQYRALNGVVIRIVSSLRYWTALHVTVKSDTSGQRFFRKPTFRDLTSEYSCTCFKYQIIYNLNSTKLKIIRVKTMLSSFFI